MTTHSSSDYVLCRLVGHEWMVKSDDSFRKYPEVVLRCSSCRGIYIYRGQAKYWWYSTDIDPKGYSQNGSEGIPRDVVDIVKSKMVDMGYSGDYLP